MSQLPLFDAQGVVDRNGRPAITTPVQTPAARATDPETSHLAADQHTRTGARGEQQARAVAAVRAFPGCTSLELAEEANICRYELARRLPECKVAGLVRAGERRHCRISKKLAMTWWPT